MDRLHAMSVFVAVIEGGSLSAAARKLDTPLPTISRKVSELEAHLKTRLLNRSTRKLTLTDAGREYLRACTRILEDVSEAERVAAGEYLSPKGELIITAPIVFGRLHVLPVTIEFLRTYPEIDVRLMLSDRTVHLLEDHVDVALRIGNLPDSSLVAIGLGAIRHLVCASRSYLDERGVPMTPGDLSTHDCVSFEGLDFTQAWTFRSGRSDVSVPIHSRLVVNTAEAAIDAALAGLGLTRVLSYQVANARHAGTLAVVLRNFEPAPWPVNLVHAGQGLLPLKLRAFLDFSVPRLRARLADARDSRGR